MKYFWRTDAGSGGGEPRATADVTAHLRETDGWPKGGWERAAIRNGSWLIIEDENGKHVLVRGSLLD